ncbi:DNA polymerase III, gamma subunit [Deinococcus reticulitermitis]|uniref:DNA polymerase III subunit gamma/tau n=1 Tax=Deinococcus reticulitermitis TaxID=856736 RepID=A0A1H6YH00_9DEIO|nr:DNA polymerase III subunit gamma/tau [Deinococcus reticulitermitis]SEJ40588.1 DNA polymerase III, gamma subunit [Deinococcus reticulitermitis]
MSAIYQRARPVRWEDVVGQDHVKDVLKTALEQGRVGHAYLFSGPRGVGKTTTARLIAMTANCSAPGPKPCGECESCLSVRAGSHPDVLEIDAASNNGVDDVRDLREKVGLAAMRGGKKIYILDEAHMMTKSAFNALLKTLEEPPGHVIFILATTEPEKIIPTILSRCQHYRFRRLTPEEIAGKLAGLAEQEGAQADPEALSLIGRLADGAMRDGESLLERMLAAGSSITRSAVEEALGLPPGERVRAVAGALLIGDVGAALSGAAQLYRDGFAARTVVEGLVAAFGSALHAELGLGEEGRLEGAEVPRLLRLQAALDEQEARFARSADGQSLELALTHALLAADGGGAGGGSAVTAPASSVPADLVQRLGRLEKELAGLRAGPRPESVAPAREATPVRAAVSEALAEVPAPTPAPSAALRGSWADVLGQVSMQVRAFLKPARMHAQPGYVSLTYEQKNAFHAKQIAGKFDELAAVVARVFGPVEFELIAPDGLGRREPPGGGAAGGKGAPLTPPPTPAPAPARAQGPAPTARAEIPDFDPAPRRTRRGPDFEPVTTEPAGAPAAASPAPRAPAPRVASLPARPPGRPGANRPAPPLNPAPDPETRLPRPASPDDVAPAPLPAESAPWEAEHAADPPPAPADAQGGDRTPPPGASRELYLGEVITEEPNWDDFGSPPEEGGTPPLDPLLDDAPFAEYSAPRPAPRPAPAPAQQLAAPTRPGDIRAHPLYDEIKNRFSGRVREIGKNRKVQAAGTEADEESAGEDDAAEGAGA